MAKPPRMMIWGLAGTSGVVLLALLAWWGLSAVRSAPDPPPSGGEPVESETQPSEPSAQPVVPGLPAEPLPLAAPGRDLHLQQLAEAARATANAIDAQTLAALTAQPEETLSRSGEIPRHRRWQFFLPDGLTTREYARLLDGLGIELAVVVGSELQYARQLSDPMPQRRSGPVQDERRLYLAWEHGRLEEADRQLLQAAGIDPAGRVVVHLIPPELEEKMAAIEQQFANRQASAIRTTRFSVRYGEGGYEVYVVKQEPLR